jgi:Glycosyl hydrolase family 3 N terminal domain
MLPLRHLGHYVFIPFAIVLLTVSVNAQSSAASSSQPPKPWMNTSLSPDQRADLVIEQMTLDDKIQLLHGAGLQGLGEPDPSIVHSNGGGGFVPGIPRLGLPDLNMNDATIGSGGGARKGRYSTALPSALALASSWNLDLAGEWGALLGSELADQGYNVSLCGGVNLTREPRNGRNFEYQGEDPILAGNMMARLIQGVQAQGVIGDIKHYAMNDEETGRYFENILADKRSMRESDLLAFEIGVKQGKPGMVMCSYNLISLVGLGFSWRSTHDGSGGSCFCARVRLRRSAWNKVFNDELGRRQALIAGAFFSSRGRDDHAQSPHLRRRSSAPSTQLVTLCGATSRIKTPCLTPLDLRRR